MTATGRELANGGIQRGATEPVGPDLPPWERSAGELQTDNLPAAAGTTEAGPFSKMPQFRDVDTMIYDCSNFREHRATYSGEANVVLTA